MRRYIKRYEKLKSFRVYKKYEKIITLRYTTLYYGTVAHAYSLLTNTPNWTEKDISRVKSDIFWIDSALIYSLFSLSRSLSFVSFMFTLIQSYVASPPHQWKMIHFIVLVVGITLKCCVDIAEHSLTYNSESNAFVILKTLWRWPE